MTSDRKINAHLSRSKFAIFLVIGFLALITYLLIVISNQLAQTESVTTESQAAMLNGGLRQGLQYGDGMMNQENMILEDDLNEKADTVSSCYTITGQSGSGLDPDPRRRTCTDLSYQCNLREYSADEYESIVAEIQRVLEGTGYTGQCSVIEGAPGRSLTKIDCTDDTRHACSNFGGGEITGILNNFCECPVVEEVGTLDPGTGDEGSIGRACGWEINRTYDTSLSPFTRCSLEYTGASFTCADGSTHNVNNKCYDKDSLEDMMQQTCC